MKLTLVKRSYYWKLIYGFFSCSFSWNSSSVPMKFKSMNFEQTDCTQYTRFFLNLPSSNILTRTYPPDFLANTFAFFRCPERPSAAAVTVCSPLVQIASVLCNVALQDRPASCSLPSSFVRLPRSSLGQSPWKPKANGVRKTCAVLYIHCQACLSVPPHIARHLRLLRLPLQ